MKLSHTRVTFYLVCMLCRICKKILKADITLQTNYFLQIFPFGNTGMK